MSVGGIGPSPGLPGHRGRGPGLWQAPTRSTRHDGDV